MSWMRLRISCLLNRLAVDLLHQRDEFVLADGGDAIQHLVGVFVAGLNTLKVQHAEGAQLGQANGHAHVHHAVHGAGDDRDLALDAPQGPTGIGDLGVHRATPRHQSDFIDSVGPANGLGASELNVHRATSIKSDQATNRDDRLNLD